MHDLVNMDRAQLQALGQQVDRQIKALEKGDKAEALRAAKAAAAEHGFRLADLVKGSKNYIPTGTPRYRSPDDPSQTWTGKGRQPNWFKAAVASGVAPEAMEIDG